MSGLEGRCNQFHEAALGSGKTKGAAKEIATLRKFLHKNQTQRFTDKAAAHLFDTISIYASHEDGEALLEDALKMPFTVFSTKQKSKMLKWIEERRGGRSEATTDPSSTKARAVILTVMDIDGTSVSLMNSETGDAYENVQISDSKLLESIQTAFDTTDDVVDVKATVQNETVTVLDLASS